MNTDTELLIAAIKRRDEISREALQVYRTATPDQWDIAVCDRREMLVPGGNRSGKTVSAAAVFASRVLGQPMWTHESRDKLTEIHRQCIEDQDFASLRRYFAGEGAVKADLLYPFATPKRGKLYWIVGWQKDHIGQTIHRLLFRPGAFTVIRDQETKLWRMFNPADPEDVERQDEEIDAGPFIPPRLIDHSSWVWDSEAGGKKDHIFRSVTLKNGAVIKTYSSNAPHPKQGDPVDGIWVDEDVQKDNQIDELQRRLLDRANMGKWFMWSVYPHRKNASLIKLKARVKKKDPNITSIQLRFSHNPFMDRTSVDWSTEMAGTPDQVRRRDHGEMLLDELDMYTTDEELHGVGKIGGGRGRYSLLNLRAKLKKGGEIVTRREVLTAVYDNDGCFPDTWTRYLSIDPSNTRTACKFLVVPPKEVEGVAMRRCVVLEKELVVKKCSAKELAKLCKPIIGNRHYEAFVMDKRCGQQTHAGREDNAFEHYEKAFKAEHLKSRQSKHGFIPGCDVPPTRWRIVRSYLKGEVEGDPDFYYVIAETVETQREFLTYRKKQIEIDGELVTLDEPAHPRKFDCMASVEYGLTFIDELFEVGKAYVEPETYEEAPGVTSSVQEGTKTIQRIMALQGQSGGSSSTPYSPVAY